MEMSQQPPKLEPRERRRGRPGYDVESLLRKSVEVFNAKGFNATSMEDLSARLGISKSAIYHHVSSKDELLELAINRALDGLADAVERTRQLDVTAIERLERMVRESVVLLVQEKPFVTLLLRVRGNTHVERRALERRRSFDHYAASLVAEAAANGSVRGDIDPEVTARLLFGMVNSLTEWVHPERSKDGADRVADAVCAVVFSGIRGPQPNPPRETAQPREPEVHGR